MAYQTTRNAGRYTVPVPKPATTTSAYVAPKPIYTAPKVTALTSYSNDYQAEINKRAAINPNDPTISQLTALRTAKIATQTPAPTNNMVNTNPVNNVDSYANQPIVYGATNPDGGLKDVNIYPQNTAIQPPIMQQETTLQMPQQIDPSIAINELKQAQIAANMAALDKSLGNQMTNVNSQYAGIDSNAYAARNVAAGESDVAAMNFAQRAAARGIQGNAASMPEIYRNSALQGRLGGIDQSAMNNRNALDSQKTNLQNSYESDRVAIQSGAESQALQNLIDQQNTNRQFALQEAGVTGSYNGAQTMAAQSQMLSNQMAELNIAAQEIENSYLPQTLKDEATQLQQQVENGRIGIATALAQLNQIGKSTSSYSSSSGSGTYQAAAPTGSIDMNNVNSAFDSVSKFMLNGNTSSAASAIIQKYQNGTLTKSEANYVLKEFELPTIS